MMNDTVYKVYWSQVEGDQMTSKFKDFDKDGMTAALKYMETLRGDRGIRFISMSVENPDSVGKQGVDEVNPDTYDWKKRRI